MALPDRAFANPRRSRAGAFALALPFTWWESIKLWPAPLADDGALHRVWKSSADAATADMRRKNQAADLLKISPDQNKGENLFYTAATIVWRIYLATANEGESVARLAMTPPPL